MGEAEEDQHVFAAEVLIGDRLSVLVDQGEGAADQRLAGGRHLGPGGASGDNERGGAASAPIRKPATMTVRKRPRIYSPNWTSVPLTRALARNRLKVT